MTETLFPRHVYKGTEDGVERLVVRGEEFFYDSELVKNEEELKKALSRGFNDAFASILLQDEESVKSEQKQELEDDDDF